MTTLGLPRRRATAMSWRPLSSIRLPPHVCANRRDVRRFIVPPCVLSMPICEHLGAD